MPLFAVLRHTAACDESESSGIDTGTKVPDCKFLSLGNIQSCVCVCVGGVCVSLCTSEQTQIFLRNTVVLMIPHSVMLHSLDLRAFLLL